MFLLAENNARRSVDPPGASIPSASRWQGDSAGPPALPGAAERGPKARSRAGNPLQPRLITLLVFHSPGAQINHPAVFHSAGWWVFTMYTA